MFLPTAHACQTSSVHSGTLMHRHSIYLLLWPPVKTCITLMLVAFINMSSMEEPGAGFSYRPKIYNFIDRHELHWQPE